MNLFKATTSRVEVLRRYFSAAPSVGASGRWLILGAVRARLTGGEARLRRLKIGGHRNFCVRVGPDSAQVIRLDLGSQAELDGFEEIFVRKIYRLERLPFEPTLILDCGANIGLFASLCRMRYARARIACWEPQRDNFERLRTQPMLQDSLVEISADAVHDSDGEICFSGAGLGGRVVNDGDADSRRVRALDLRRWLAHQPEQPTLVKIDVEGHEERLVPSLVGVWPRTCALFLETHQAPGKDAALLKILESEGFRWELLASHVLPNISISFNEYFALRTSN